MLSILNLRNLRVCTMWKDLLKGLSVWDAESVLREFKIIQQLEALGEVFSLSKLRAAGNQAQELQRAGFSGAERARAGFDAKTLKWSWCSARELRDIGFGSADLVKAGVG